MAIQDLVLWEQANVEVAGDLHHYRRGDILPPPADQAENDVRVMLRVGGAVRVIPAEPGEPPEVPETPEPPETPDTPDPEPPEPPDPGEPDEPGNGEPEPEVAKPPAYGTKGAWVNYAVSQGMDRDEAESMTRDELVHHYRDDEPG